MLWNSLKLGVVSGFDGVAASGVGGPGIKTPGPGGRRAAAETGWAGGIFAARAWVESRARGKAGQGAGVVKKVWTRGANVEKALESGKGSGKWKNRWKWGKTTQSLAEKAFRPAQRSNMQSP